MKPTENMEPLVRNAKPHITTGESMDRRVLGDSFAAMDKTLAAKEPGSLRMILRSRVTRLAAVAAAVVIVAGLLFTRDRHAPNPPAPGPQLTAQSPATMLSMMSLRMAYQQGGWDALDRQLWVTLNKFGPISSSLSVQRLLEDSNGS